MSTGYKHQKRCILIPFTGAQEQELSYTRRYVVDLFDLQFKKYYVVMKEVLNTVYIYIVFIV